MRFFEFDARLINFDLILEIAIRATLGARYEVAVESEAQSYTETFDTEGSAKQRFEELKRFVSDSRY